MKRIFDEENDLDGSSWPPSDIDWARNLSIHSYYHPQPPMDSKAEAEYSRFLHDTINAASHGLFELANNDPLIYPLQRMVACPCSRAPGSTFHSLHVKGAVTNVLSPFHSQELMALLCCYIEGVYVRTAEDISGIGCLGGFNHWRYHPGFWSLQEAAASPLLHLNECTDLRAEGNAFRVGGLYVGVLLS
jgi:hypothetical protein